jgi:hypothetical protein
MNLPCALVLSVAALDDLVLSGENLLLEDLCAAALVDASDLEDLCGVDERVGATAHNWVE